MIDLHGRVCQLDRELWRLRKRLDEPLSENERDMIRDNFDAWGHDYTQLYPVVEQIIRGRKDLP